MKAIFTGVAAFIVLVTFILSTETVDQTERVVTTRFGAVSGVLEPGFHLVNPFTTSIHTMDVSENLEQEVYTSYSKDSQIVDVEVAVNYKLSPASVRSVYEDVRTDWKERYVFPRISDAVKNVISKYTAQGIIENRGVIPQEIRAELNTQLEENGIIISKVSVTNFDFDDAYEAAVQKKQVQEQEALAQANITAQEEEKKKQEILKAEALAEKTRLEVQALSMSNGSQIIEKIRAEAQLEAAKRWNGQLPNNMYGSAPIPMIGIQ